MRELLREYVRRVDMSKTLVLLTVCSSFLFTNYALVQIPIPENNKDAFHIFVGVIDASALLVFGFYFGSSKGEVKKTELMNKNNDLMSKMVDKQPDNV